MGEADQIFGMGPHEMSDLLAQIGFALAPRDQTGIVEVVDLPEMVLALKADLDRERFARRAIDQALLDAVAERDRLQAVVDALRADASTLAKVLVHGSDDTVAAVLGNMRAALDVSPTGEDT
jgi:hypothetical protein